MSESPGEAAAQGEGDTRSSVSSRYSAPSQLGGWLTIEVLLGTTRGGHMASLAGCAARSNEAEVPAFRYAGT